jgi:signal transduction histidine kinase
MSQRAVAVRLSVIVALAGLLPIAGVGIFGIELLRSRSERAAEDSLRDLAEQVAARTSGYLGHQRQLLRSIAAVASSPRIKSRLEETVLEAPSLGRVTVLDPSTPDTELPRGLTPAQVADARAGKEVSSEWFLSDDTTPAMTACAPARQMPGQALCAQLDLLELWRFVQRIHAGASGYVLVFDDSGRLLASGSGKARAAILTGERISSSAEALALLKPTPAARVSYVGAEGVPVIAGWASLPDERWAVAVEQPASEALGSARTAQWVLAAVLLFALVLSVLMGLLQSARVLSVLATEERWKTAGRIATGLTHDLGHRLRILQQTGHLAATGDPASLPIIRDNLASEVSTLQKFVADFAVLGRDVRAVELLPLELGAFLNSVARIANAQAQPAGVSLELSPPPEPVWVQADRYLVERALLNLLSNAIEASPKGAVVRLFARAEGSRALLGVTDSGAGIEPARLARLFDAFVTTKRTGAHLGMGLANVKRIVDAHGGAVSVTSVLGTGTTFTIALTHLSSSPPEPSGESP